MSAREELLIVDTTGGQGPPVRGTIYLHVPTGRMVLKTDNVTGGAWAVSFTSADNPMVTAWGSADSLTEEQADALVEEWISKL